MMCAKHSISQCSGNGTVVTLMIVVICDLPGVTCGLCHDLPSIQQRAWELGNTAGCGSWSGDLAGAGFVQLVQPHRTCAQQCPELGLSALSLSWD